MKKCIKHTKKNFSTFKFVSNHISNDIKCILLNLSLISNKCSCGCNRSNKSIHSFILKSYFSSKFKWIRFLGVNKSRISQLSDISNIINNNGCTDQIFNSLDLNLVETDLIRQPWVDNNERKKLAETSIYTFCIYNNIGYWQGIHDVAVALTHLEPTPNVGELVALLEQLTNKFAPILYSSTPNEVSEKAKELSFRWRLFFKYFFPKASHEYDKFCDNSFSINWFITLGFYRFDCAYICLAYTFLLIISRNDEASTFFFRELAYIASRGYVSYLHHNKVSVDFNNSVIFSNFSNSSLIVNSLVNSNKMLLKSEDFINISRNPYDTFNGKELELYEFPLLYLFKCSNILMSSSPSVNTIDSKREFLDISTSKIFQKNNQINLFECQFKVHNGGKRFSKTYRRNSYMDVLRSYRRINSMSYDSLYDTSPSTIINCEIAFSYISSLRRFSNLYPHRLKLIDTKQCNDFLIGSVLNPNLIYNFVDLRSECLLNGKSLEHIFGTYKTNFISKIDLNEILESSFLDTNFTLWVIITDDGYDIGDDQNSIESLNKGIRLMEYLSSNSITCVTLLKGGYKGLLKSINEEIPQSPSILSRLNVKRFVNWGVNKVIENNQPNRLSQIATSLFSGAVNIENRIVQGISDIKLFSRFESPQLQQSTIMPERMLTFKSFESEVRSYSTQEIFDNNTNRFIRLSLNKIKYKINYCIKIRTGSGFELTVNTKHSISINGIILHPSNYSYLSKNKMFVIILFLFSNFKVNLVDRIFDLDLNSTHSISKVLKCVPKYFIHYFEDIITKYMIITHQFNDVNLPKSLKHISLASNIAGLINGYRIKGVLRLWNFIFIERYHLLSHLLCYSLNYELLNDYNVESYQYCDKSSKSEYDEISYSTFHNENNLSTVRSINKELNLQFHKFIDIRNIKVFSRTHDCSSNDLSSSRLSNNSSNSDGKVYVNRVSSGVTVPLMYNTNVFVSRSSINRSKKSKL